VPEVIKLTPANYKTVNDQVLFHFHNPPLGFKILDDKDAALMTIPTFIYYDKVDFFRNFMDSCFALINTEKINNLILDVRGNTGGDPFCASILLSYLQTREVPYFSEPYGRYQSLSEPLPLPENHFKGNLFTLVDGGCGSTNGHFCALLKYYNIGKFVGTPSGATYKCNAGRNTELRLTNTQMIITIGRSTYAAAVKNMDTSAIWPDLLVEETYEAFLAGKDVFIETALREIEQDSK
jgi:C-terminal processing protease CtpA/Prc